nr:MAG TPA: hypothetical protein [Bacteriophage sp.]
MTINNIKYIHNLKIKKKKNRLLLVYSVDI